MDAGPGGGPLVRRLLNLAVVIYRLISLWLVLLVGWVLFLVISARGARRAAAQAAAPQLT
jgi:uncharacterized membrane protein YbhN (UPF0104 family)